MIEIIKTDDPNIVIERKTIDNAINLAELLREKEDLIGELAEIDLKISKLEQLNAEGLIGELVQAKINELLNDKHSPQQKLNDINDIIDNQNG